MWPFRFSQYNKIIGISIHPATITCSWFEDKNGSFHIRAYDQLPLAAYEINEQRINNPTRIQQFVQSFVQKHRLAHNYVTIAIGLPGLTEKIVSLSNPPEAHHVHADQADAGTWSFQRIGLQRGSGKAQYYLCSMPSPLLVQYQLLAHTAKLRILTLTSSRMALWRACKQIDPAKMETATLTNHAHLQSTISHIIESCTLNKFISLPNNEKKRDELIESIGLHLLGKDTYETD